MSTLENGHCITCGTISDVFIQHIVDDRYGCPGEFSIQRCDNCGQMATAPRLTESELPALYSQYYPRKKIDFGALEKEADRVIKPYAEFRRWLAGTNNQGHYLATRGQKVLDIGSGSCLSLLEMRAMGVDAWGVEADPNIRSIADRYGLKVHIGSVHDLPFAGNLFDLIVLNQVIEHVPDPLVLLRAVRGRLNVGGRVILSFPNVDSWQRKLSGRRWINWHVPYHQHHFNRHSFTLLANKAGYEIGKLRTITPNLWTLLQLRAMFGKTQEGCASATWEHEGRTNKTTIAVKIRKLIIASLTKFIVMTMALHNRCVDAIGKGDSILVELHLPVERR